MWRFGKTNKLNIHNSTHFAQAAYSLVALGTELAHGSLTSSRDITLQKRTADFEKSAALQRALETQCGIPRHRSLKTSLDLAAERHLFGPRPLRRLEKGGPERERCPPPALAVPFRWPDVATEGPAWL